MIAVADKMITALFVFVLGTLWFFSTKYEFKPKQYIVIIYDVFGKETNIDGLRTIFQTREVASSYVKEYQKTYPMFQFGFGNFFPVEYRSRSSKFFSDLITHR